MADQGRITAWNADKVFAWTLLKLRRNAEDAGEHLVAAVQRKISTQGPPPSAPGEPPHRDTGALMNSITYATPDGGLLRSIIGQSSFSLIVGSDLDYAGILEGEEGQIGAAERETGSSRTATRPFLRPTLAEEGPAVFRIMTR